MALKGLKELLKKIRDDANITEEQVEEELNKILPETWIPKNKFNELAESEKLAKSQLEATNKQLEELKKSATLTEDQKKQLETLKAQLEEQERKYQQELTATKRGYALEQALIKAKARDVKSVLPHIDQSKLAWGEDHSLAGGLKEQLEALQKEKAFLFETEPTPAKPSFGGQPGGQTLTGEAALQAQFAEKLGIKTK